MTKFTFVCPVCLIAVRGRTFRRHLKRVHGHDCPKDFYRNARRRVKTERRSFREDAGYRWRTWVNGPVYLMTMETNN